MNRPWNAQISFNNTHLSPRRSAGMTPIANIARMPMGCGGLAPPRRNFYENPYDSGKDSQWNRYRILAGNSAPKNRSRQQRQFGRSYRWGTPLGGLRTRPFQYSSRPLRSPMFGQVRQSTLSPRMSRYASSPFSPFSQPSRRNPMQSMRAPRYGSTHPRYQMSSLSRSYPPVRPMYARGQSYLPPEDDDDDFFIDDDDWGDSDAEDAYDWDCKSRDEDYYDDYTQHSPYSAYRGFSNGYDDYDDDDYSDGMYPRPYGYGRPSSYRHLNW